MQIMYSRFESINWKELILNVKFWLFCRYISLSSSKQLQSGAFLVPPLPTTLGGWLKLSKPVKKASPVLIDSIVSCLHVKKFYSYSLVFFFIINTDHSLLCSDRNNHRGSVVHARKWIAWMTSSCTLVAMTRSMSPGGWLYMLNLSLWITDTLSAGFIR